MRPMKLVIASNNAHKIREFRLILPEFEIVSPKELGLEFYHEETGTTFYENALGKAGALRNTLLQRGEDSLNCNVLADDSGLVVHSLGGEPGVYSARYGWREGERLLSDRDRNLLLLKNMEEKSDRGAHYVCCMAMVAAEDTLYCVQESWQGSIAWAESGGTGGFGYDPIFWLEESQCTVAELEPGKKETISHRAKAMRKMVSLLHMR